VDRKPTYEELIQRVKELEAETSRLQASEKWYREIFNATNDAIFIHDAKSGAILEVNQTMLEMYGYGYEEALELTIADLSQETDEYSQQEALELLNRTVAEKPQVFPWIAKKKSGERFWVEVALRSSEIMGQQRDFGGCSGYHRTKTDGRATGSRGGAVP
jgi:PAS domain S-box-containing protein